MKGKAAKIRIGIMTSGGDAQGMNASVRAVVRTVLHMGAEIYGIYDGYWGLQHPEKGIKKLERSSVSGILGVGGTSLGTARCKEMMTLEGRRKAVHSLVSYGIDRLVCIGGDGSLTGAECLRSEWKEHIEALTAEGKLEEGALEKHPVLSVVGIPGTIDNDMCGSDITIGADTALHRIIEAVDAIFSTAASHQRTFVVEVMGRHCGYLAVMTGLATGAEWILIPEVPCQEGWEEKMGQALSQGRKSGKRAAIVIVAEGARDVNGNHISSEYVQKVLSERMGEDARVTILGHVQRGGAPSAYDRNLGTIMGLKAAQVIMQEHVDPSVVVGLNDNGPVLTPLMEAVEETHKAQEYAKKGDSETALRMRCRTLADSYRLFQIINSNKIQGECAHPKRIAILHSGASAPGMNTAVRNVVRLAIAKGHSTIAVRGGFDGLIRANLRPMDWMDVSGWAGRGGAEIGTSHKIPQGAELYAVARSIEDNKIDALIMIGGWDGYEAIYTLYRERESYPAFNIPMICIPASIDNNLPGSEYSIGANTAVNSIVESVDKIKSAAVADNKCFLIEVMGDDCGFLAEMSGLASGAEKVYLPERPMRSADILKDIEVLKEQFMGSRSVAFIINSEKANPIYNTGVLEAMFRAEGEGCFEVRKAILGHLQQGGDPSPFDRTLASQLAAKAVDLMCGFFEDNLDFCGFIGYNSNGIESFHFDYFKHYVDKQARRPRQQWWTELIKFNDVLS
ncbi:6-phosphofructokinase [bacterium]|nr:6-phosphofructokinase [bacterium]